MSHPPATPRAFRHMRQQLGLTVPQLSRLSGVSPDGIRRMERDDEAISARPVNPVLARLLAAYRAGYRPPDWPSQPAGESAAA